MSRWTRHFTFPLRTALVTAVVTSAVLVIMIAVGSIGLPAYWKVRTAIRGLWGDLAKESAESATNQILRYFQSAPVTLKFVRDLVIEKELGVTDLEMLLDICYHALRENPDFVSVYYAKENGTFYGVFRIGEGYQGSYRTIGTDGKTSVKNYKIGKDNCWEQTGQEISTYDPRTRPFWKTGKEHPEGGWSDPYQFVTTKATGYSFVLAQKKGSVVDGYWAVDFQINRLTDYLQSLKVGKQGGLYIIADNGSIIARSTQQMQPSSVQGFNQIITDAWSRYIQEGEKSGFLNIEHRIFYVNRFPMSSGIPWSLATIIHEDDVFQPIREDAYNSLLIGLIPCFLFLAFAAIFFGRISHRLKEIASEMDYVGNLKIDFSQREMVLSRIREINTMNQSLHKMKIGLKSFAKYVPLDLINKLIQSGRSAELGGEKREVSILFADMVQFTTLAEQVGPAEVAHIIEKFLSMASNAVHTEKGIVDKFMGDAVMAIWGAPEPIPSSALNACWAALAMQKNAELSATMNHRIGINTGQAMVGNLGSHDRMDYTAVGDSVNIAARLEKLNKKYGTKILIGPQTAEAVKELLLVRPLDYVMLQGRSHPLLVYELRTVKSGAPEKLVQAITIYTSALENYRKREFAQAATLFDEARKLFGNSDVASFMLARRCRDFIKNPPPSDWDGTAIDLSSESGCSES